ncbi:MAG: CoA-binding protein [Chloroflexi bacterium]|nr:CoA-binding protein [Chloroflexota bacterium]
MKVDFSKLDRAFNPRRFVVIGDRAKGRWLNVGKEYQGELYSVQLNPETAKAIEESGIKNYTSLLDVPGPIDLVIVTAPRKAALQIVEDCIRRGDVGALHFFTAGFSETSTEEGVNLEKIITEKAKAANLHLIGPNCMGIYNARVGLGQNVWPYTGFAAPICFISQSGTHATTFGQHAYLQGMDVNKEISFGNGLVLDSADFLEYFDYDAEIKVIGMYLEGVRDGKRFLKILKKVAAHKPVVIWKGGRTEEGDRAIASHTASLAVTHAVWTAVVRQCGAVPVSSMEELIDTMKALLYFPPVFGDRVGIVGGSGGPSVAIADTFAEAGLKVPRLTEASYTELASFFSLIGGGYRNPVDTGNANRREIKRIMEILARDANTDNLALLTGSRWGMMATPETDITLLEETCKMTPKPVMAIVSYVTPDEMKESQIATKKFQEKGVAAFPSMERGARALQNALDYYRHRNRIAD